MPRLMSFALTERQLLDGSKTVTRRIGWKFLKPGDEVVAVRKAMGLKKGEKVERLATLRIVSVRRERLYKCDNIETKLEGFPDLDCYEFVRMFLPSICGATQSTK